MRTLGRVVLVAAMTVAAAGVVIAASAEDDLAVVKRAVRQEAPASTPPETAGAKEPITGADETDAARERRSEARPPTSGPGRELRWFKVRITEKGSKKARVNVNLPIALVRALDDFPIDIGRHTGWRGGREKTIRLGEVLATLEAGQPLVEIDDDDATVRVWVE